MNARRREKKSRGGERRPPKAPVLVATVPRSCESLLVNELTELGLRARIHAPGIVHARGDEATFERARENCRCAQELSLLSPGDAEPRALVRPALTAPGPTGVVPDLVVSLALRAARVGPDDRTLFLLGGRDEGGEEVVDPTVVVSAFPGERTTQERALFSRLLRRYRCARHLIITNAVRLDSLPETLEARRWRVGSSAWAFLLITPGEWEDTFVRVRPFRGIEPAAWRAPPGADGDARTFLRILNENTWLRRRWPERQGIDAYRLYDRELDAIPWAVDRYGTMLHITIYPLGSPGEPRTITDDARTELLIHLVEEAVGVDPTRVFVKRKEKRPAGVQHEVQAREGCTEVVRENGLAFIVNLSDYVDTGLFLDHRLTRAWVREHAAGKRVLNLFGYTGSFTVAAAAGSASSTVTVDTSAPYLDWARENLRRNRIEAEPHRLVRADAMEFLRTHPPGEAYDLAIVDPPTRSNRHGSELTWDVQRDHAELLALLRPLVVMGGTVLFSTNFRRFRLDPAALPGWSIEETTPGSIPPDIGDRKIHRCWRLTRVE